MRTRLASFVLAFVATGCGADLPPGWEDAEPVASLTQDACTGSPYEGYDERMEATAAAGEIRVDVLEAHFRCEQEVEGFVRRRDGAVDLLIQPRDMRPDVVAACDCLYDVHAVVDGVATGTTTVTAYRRWDRYGGNDTTPVEIGSAEVEVP